MPGGGWAHHTASTAQHEFSDSGSVPALALGSRDVVSFVTNVWSSARPSVGSRGREAGWVGPLSPSRFSDRIFEPHPPSGRSTEPVTASGSVGAGKAET